VVLVSGNLLLRKPLFLVLGPEAVGSPFLGGCPNQCLLAERKRVKITYNDPQLDQGSEEVIRVMLGTYL
jgi:hypothetical protein